jgi:hypothetical protein
MPGSGGSDKISLKYIGRIVKPKFYDAWLENGRNNMQLQSGKNVYQEGLFIADPTPASRLGTERLLGDKLLGWFIVDSPARYIRGKVYEGCC